MTQRRMTDCSSRFTIREGRLIAVTNYIMTKVNVILKPKSCYLVGVIGGVVSS